MENITDKDKGLPLKSDSVSSKGSLGNIDKLHDTFQNLIMQIGVLKMRQPDSFHEPNISEPTKAYLNLGSLFNEPLHVHTLCTFEYPQSSYRLIKQGLSLTNDDYQTLMGHTWASVRSRNEDSLISVEHSEKLVHNIQIMLKGLEVFGNEEAMNRWLRKFNPFLSTEPIALLKTITGTEMVLEEMDRLLEGSLA